MSDHPAELPFTSRRSPVYGRRGMVAASQPLAVAAGLEILAAGGNAADAAVATAAALNVTEPTSTGIGGDCFALFYEAATGQVTALNGSGRAPAALTLERLRARASARRAAALPRLHGHRARRVRGLVRPDRAPRPAAAAAHPGAGHPPGGGGLPGRADHRLLTGHAGPSGSCARRPAGRELTIDGRAPAARRDLPQPGPGAHLPRGGRGRQGGLLPGRDRRGDRRAVQAAGGCMTVEDLAAHISTWDEPISTTYRGLRVWECPPNGQGLAALLALNMLEGFDLAALDPLSPERLHLEIEAMRLAFADTRWYVADPRFTHVPLASCCRRHTPPTAAS